MRPRTARRPAAGSVRRPAVRRGTCRGSGVSRVPARRLGRRCRGCTGRIAGTPSRHGSGFPGPRRRRPRRTPGSGRGPRTAPSARACAGRTRKARSPPRTSRRRSRSSGRARAPRRRASSSRVSGTWTRGRRRPPSWRSGTSADPWGTRATTTPAYRAPTPRASVGGVPDGPRCVSAGPRGVPGSAGGRTRSGPPSWAGRPRRSARRAGRTASPAASWRPRAAGRAVTGRSGGAADRLRQPCVGAEEGVVGVRGRDQGHVVVPAGEGAALEVQQSEPRHQ